MLITLRPDLHVNSDEVAYVQLTMERIPGKDETKDITAIVFKHKATLYIDLDIDYVVAMLNDQCTYKDRWTDGVGNIPICIIHDNNSRHNAWEGPHRPCLTVDPYPPALKTEIQPAPTYIYEEPKLGPIARFFSRGGH